MAAQNTSSIISSVYKSRRNLLQLMAIQGYDTDSYSDFSINEVNAMFQNEQLDMLLEKKSKTDASDVKKMYIRYYLGKTLSAQNIQDMMDDLFHLEEVLTKKDTLMIVTKNEITDYGIAIIQTATDPKVVAALQEYALEVSDLAERSMEAVHEQMIKQHH